MNDRPKFKRATIADWKAKPASYTYLPRALKDQVDQFDMKTMFKTLQDPANDALVCFVLGQVGEKALKGLDISQFHEGFISLPRLLFERATAGDSDGG